MEHYHRYMAPEFGTRRRNGHGGASDRSYPERRNMRLPAPSAASFLRLTGPGARKSLTMDATQTTPAPMFIVEDDDHFRETFIDVMSLKGVEVSGARNRDDAIKALKQNKPTIIIKDINLPDVRPRLRSPAAGSSASRTRRTPRSSSCPHRPSIPIPATAPRVSSPAPPSSCRSRSASSAFGRRSSRCLTGRPGLNSRPRGLLLRRLPRRASRPFGASHCGRSARRK